MRQPARAVPRITSSYPFLSPVRSDRAHDILGNLPPEPSLKSLALHAIRFYQRFLSPHKGFCCAYASVTGHASCSALGYRAIRRFGVWRGMGILDRRLVKCGVAYRRHRHRPVAVRHGPLKFQGGFLDCLSCDMPAGCDLPCDLPGDLPCSGPFGCHVPEACGDLAACGLDCDWRRRRSQDDEFVVIPVRGDGAGRR